MEINSYTTSLNMIRSGLGRFRLVPPSRFEIVTRRESSRLLWSKQIVNHFRRSCNNNPCRTGYCNTCISRGSGYRRDRRGEPMQLVCAEVANFRLLENVTVQIDESTTLIVGRNNSGKTSFVNLFERFFGDDLPKFVLDDLSASRIADIEKAVRLCSEEQDAEGDAASAGQRTDEALELLPSIKLVLTISYTEDDDLAPITELILDLDEDCHEVKIEAVVAFRSPLEFLNQASQAVRAGEFDAHKYLPKAFTKHATVTFHAVGAGSASGERVEISRTMVRGILSTMFVYAQTKFDDVPADRTRNLSKTFEAFYKANSDDEHLTIAEIERVLKDASKELDRSLKELFKTFLQEVSFFGENVIGPIQQPLVVSEFDAVGLMRGNTRIKYLTGDSNYPLPEGHNGLGYSKLIFLILQVVSFFETYQRASPRPALQILFIEEPEAHLHPQMQETFIRNITDFIKRKTGWHVQVIITTHSSHIVASGEFDAVRYFDRTGQKLLIKDLATFQHQTDSGQSGAVTLRFLTQYLVLHRCDMFFADKVILIEGTTERLLMPRMIRMCAEALCHQYVSVIEVGDAYAGRFRDLLAFLGVKTLIVTDIDSVDPSQHRKACPTSTPGAVTCNKTLKEWLPRKDSISDLMHAEDADKEAGRIRVAYQIAEETGKACGRSFEEAFILANAETLAKDGYRLALSSLFTDDVEAPLTAEDLAVGAWDIAKSLKDKKTDFAFDIMLLEYEWIVPRYIREGLQWLS
ncbi:ATP-dependent endonuclease [Streptosporangium saharense]|uniref:ATP-dependent nuclease n=1 Tax=Streptosporangium saharense TaxID=1706840 RepID=UPI0036BAAE04